MNPFQTQEIQYWTIIEDSGRAICRRFWIFCQFIYFGWTIVFMFIYGHKNLEFINNFIFPTC